MPRTLLWREIYDFLYECDRWMEHQYQALLFQPNRLEDLENDEKIALKKSMLAIPLNGSLVTEAYLAGDKLLSGSESPLGKPSSMSLTIYQPANFSRDIVEEEKRTK
ncbi:hypothetical protein Tco_1316971 [Tanacetum coccineum]